MIVLWVFLGFLIGGAVGIGIMSMCFVAGKSDFLEDDYDDEGD